jgi:hypothetical protein
MEIENKIVGSLALGCDPYNTLRILKIDEDGKMLLSEKCIERIAQRVLELVKGAQNEG